jgi:hypothetical protein
MDELSRHERRAIAATRRLIIRGLRLQGSGGTFESFEKLGIEVDDNEDGFVWRLPYGQEIQVTMVETREPSYLRSRTDEEDL